MGLEIPQGMVVDHIDRNPLNNTRRNLRVVTQSQNIFNAKLPSTNTSGVKGVFWDASATRWRVKVTVNGVHSYHGSFRDVEEAKAKSHEIRSALGVA